jgi:hypothetical protein
MNLIFSADIRLRALFASNSVPAETAGAAAQRRTLLVNSGQCASGPCECSCPSTPQTVEHSRRCTQGGVMLGVDSRTLSTARNQTSDFAMRRRHLVISRAGLALGCARFANSRSLTLSLSKFFPSGDRDVFLIRERDISIGKIGGRALIPGLARVRMLPAKRADVGSPLSIRPNTTFFNFQEFRPGVPVSNSRMCS